MPLYEYKCKECKRSFEVLQKITEEPIGKCIHCAGKVEKLISVSSFQFKGSGWYITDYKSKKKGDTGNSGAGNNSDLTSIKNQNETIK